MFVYKQYDQQALDNEYNNRLHVPDYAVYLNRWETLSRKAEQELAVVKDIAYGDLPRERLDVFPSLHPRSKTLVFIHGGYWQMLDKSMFHFIANGFELYGVTTVFINYPLAPEAGMDQMVTSCRNAITWLYNNIAEFNGDREQMYVAGHSAGGHLAAMLMATDWKLFDFNMSANVLKGVCAISGLFNLEPVYHSFVNKVLSLDKKKTDFYSPILLEPLHACPLIVAVGDEETAAFKEQTNEFYVSWKNKGADIERLRLPGENHFSIADAIADRQSALHQALLRLMNIKPLTPEGA